jgi:DNA polymerase delta subunit 1
MPKDVIAHYSLNAIAKKVLGESHTKIDLPIPVMNKYYESGDPDLQAQIMEYCVMDTKLPLDILLARLTIVLQIELSRVCCVHLNDLWDRGQMFRVSSQFFLHARTKGYVVSSTVDALEEKSEGYEGATVFTPTVGVHDALVLDFASLYPTTMIANNLCATSLVPEGPPAEPDGIEYSQIQVDAEHTFTFQQSVPGLIPDLLRNLLEARKRAKKAEQSAETEALKSIMNGRQKALKVAANSIYGTQGAQNSVVGCLPLAKATTKLGREGLERCVAQLKISELKSPSGDKIDLNVIYGDTDSLFIAIDFKKVFGRPLEECKERKH